MSTAEKDPTTHDRRGRDTEVILNGRQVTVDTPELTFGQVVELSGLPTGPTIVFTITYRKGEDKKPKGSMVEGGEAVKVKDGMIFNVTFTDRS
jgi:hypothetical protein